jgi:hypothetical protein
MYYVILTNKNKNLYYSNVTINAKINEAIHFDEQGFKINYPLIGGWIFVKISDDGTKTEISNR